MLLSIVMMVKDEEKYLDKTLSSLKDLMNEINSEIIILDTGSKDNSISIAKKYTENLYFEKWNNNFSDMRNKSISYAKGDWILVIDADEVLVNYDKLVNFFKTDLYKKYNSASIELMNISSEDDEENYSLASIIRLFKNENGFCYSGSIHEQPNYKSPVYNDIASFKHYGYTFNNQEILNKKLNRNTKILLNEIDKNPNDFYINYQLGKNYFMMKLYEDAIFYIEKSLHLCSHMKLAPIYIYQDLAKLYVIIKNYKKCEKLCLKYIKEDKKNIDIYYYLGLSQYNLCKAKESIKSFELYINLIRNYNISTSANRFDCNCETIKSEDLVKLKIIENYYDLEKYDDVIKYSKNLNNDNIYKIYYIYINSLYKLKNTKEILNLYNTLKNDIDKNRLFKSIELLINNIREEDRKIIYKLFSDIDDNYGKLNKLRLGIGLNETEYNEILKIENDFYFGDIIYYGIKQGIDLDMLVKNISAYNLELYFLYLIKNKLDFEIILFNYIESKLNTLEFNNLKLYSIICKLLSKYSNLDNKKYKIIFLTYIVYRYNYLQNIYNTDEIKNNLLDIITDIDDKFVLEVYKLLSIKSEDKLKFIKNIRIILKKYPEYKKGIQILTSDIENEVNINSELESLKGKYKLLIEKSVNSNNVSDALIMVKEYEDIFGTETMYNEKAIINLYLGNIEESDKLLKLSYISDPFNEDTIFNIAYTKELNNDYEEAIYFYEKLIDISKDELLKKEITSKINSLK